MRRAGRAAGQHVLGRLDVRDVEAHRVDDDVLLLHGGAQGLRLDIGRAVGRVAVDVIGGVAAAGG